MATLPEPVKLRIVQGLACFDTPSQVAKDINVEFGLSVSPQQCEGYDPHKRAGRSLSKKFRDVFESTRKAFLADSSQISVTHRVVRLRRLERMIDRLDNAGNIMASAQLLEQVSRECAGAELAALQARLDTLIAARKK